jgi:hypothetical protein
VGLAATHNVTTRPTSNLGTVLATVSSTTAVLVLAGAIVLALLVAWAVARWWAWEPRWLVRWRHAMGEAGWRASAAWAEFTDWLRLGR